MMRWFGDRVRESRDGDRTRMAIERLNDWAVGDRVRESRDGDRTVERLSCWCRWSLIVLVVRSRARYVLCRHGSSHNNKLQQINCYSTGFVTLSKRKRKKFHQESMGSSRPNNFGELPLPVFSTRCCLVEFRCVSPEYQWQPLWGN